MDNFDVFLNHRGPDVKGGFISHLDEALRFAGLKPFVDKKSILKGIHAVRSVDEAMEKAKIHVAVVSRGYAESKWCLRELTAMMRSGKPVVPVFFDVEPTDLRRVQCGPFAEAFAKHSYRERREQVEEWADALRKLADVCGFSYRLADYRGDEAELKRELVGAIKCLMSKSTLASEDMEEVEEVEELNESEDSVRENIVRLLREIDVNRDVIDVGEPWKSKEWEEWKESWTSDEHAQGWKKFVESKEWDNRKKWKQSEWIAVSWKEYDKLGRQWFHIQTKTIEMYVYARLCCDSCLTKVKENLKFDFDMYGCPGTSEYVHRYRYEGMICEFTYDPDNTRFVVKGTVRPEAVLKKVRKVWKKAKVEVKSIQVTTWMSH
ncbi:hypothetical protein M758_7G014600 [Ceratodon purpureus]|nr:hypothetical protein M758_7G014600 [Ceratodon purpureus]